MVEKGCRVRLQAGRAEAAASEADSRGAPAEGDALAAAAPGPPLPLTRRRRRPARYGEGGAIERGGKDLAYFTSGEIGSNRSGCSRSTHRRRRSRERERLRRRSLRGSPPPRSLDLRRSPPERSLLRRFLSPSRCRKAGEGEHDARAWSGHVAGFPSGGGGGGGQGATAHEHKHARTGPPTSSRFISAPLPSSWGSGGAASPPCLQHEGGHTGASSVRILHRAEHTGERQEASGALALTLHPCDGQCTVVGGTVSYN